MRYRSLFSSNGSLRINFGTCSGKLRKFSLPVPEELERDSPIIQSRVPPLPFSRNSPFHSFQPWILRHSCLYRLFPEIKKTKTLFVSSPQEPTRYGKTGVAFNKLFTSTQTISEQTWPIRLKVGRLAGSSTSARSACSCEHYIASVKFWIGKGSYQKYVPKIRVRKRNDTKLFRIKSCHSLLYKKVTK